ncbi:hypothetical protein AYI69_g9417, partial [Smittium culicis]
MVIQLTYIATDLPDTPQQKGWYR